jgi:hypothetical protein
MRIRDIRVNERTRFWLEITFNTENGAGVPETARWKAKCETNCQDLTEWAALSVGASGTVELEIPASITRIISRRNPVERKLIAIEANYDTDDQVSAEQVIVVKNLEVTS